MADYQPAQPPTSAPPLSPSDEKTWAMLAHLGNILGFLPALLIFLIAGPRSARVKTESREALNWILTITAAFIVLTIVGVVVGILYAVTPNGVDALFGLLGNLIGLLEWALWIVNIVFSIIAAVRVNAGGSYRYPFAVRLIK